MSNAPRAHRALQHPMIQMWITRRGCFQLLQGSCFQVPSFMLSDYRKVAHNSVHSRSCIEGFPFFCFFLKELSQTRCCRRRSASERKQSCKPGKTHSQLKTVEKVLKLLTSSSSDRATSVLSSGKTRHAAHDTKSCLQSHPDPACSNPACRVIVRMKLALRMSANRRRISYLYAETLSALSDQFLVSECMLPAR
jgi:hypothetical protein